MERLSCDASFNDQYKGASFEVISDTKFDMEDVFLIKIKLEWGRDL